VHSLVLSKADWDPDGHEEGSQRFVGGGELPLPEAATVGAVGGFEGNLREQRDANVHSSMAKVTVDVGRI
jgi:hypothetical protein